MIDLSLTSTYKIAGLTVLGAEHTDVQAIKLFSSLQVGQEIDIPGDDIKRAITGLWAQGFVFRHPNRGRGGSWTECVFGHPRAGTAEVDTLHNAGVNRSEQETVKGQIDLLTGRILDDNVKAVATKRIREHYVEKGFLDVDIAMEQESDTLFANGTKLRILVDKGEKVKIDRIAFHGVEAMDTEVLARKMKDTKERRWWRFYKASKYLGEHLPSRLGQRGQSLPQRGIPQCTRAARQLKPQRGKGGGLGRLGGRRQSVLLRGHHVHRKHEVQNHAARQPA